jgi:glycosyltransferase involved in cell wall biosynthesis
VHDVLIVTGIWPPDIGGPASHGPELARFLLGRGYRVRALTMADKAGPDPCGVPVVGLRRDRPRVIRLPTAAWAVARAARRADVLYSTSMYVRSALAARLASIPLVIKLVSDPAYERARLLGLFRGSLADFQQPSHDPRLIALKWLRDSVLRGATRIVTPGRFLADTAVGWGIRRERIRVVPNPAAQVDRSLSVPELRRRLGLSGPTVVFAGRFVLQKNVPLAVAALHHAPGVALVLVGDGPERPAVEAAIARAGVAERVRLTGALSREEALDWVRAADAAVLPSDWEGFPHAAVEALAVGTPLIATRVGAVPEIIEPGRNGVLVDAGDERAFGAAIAAVTTDEKLGERLRRGADETGRQYHPDRTYAALEDELRNALSQSMGR